MLLGFRFANHRSFRDEQELDLLPVYKRESGEFRALPVAAAFGANASGKSNLLDALEFMREVVMYSFSRWDRAKGVPREPYLPTGPSRPSSFAVEVLLDGVSYQYGFTLDSDRVISESLTYRPVGRSRTIFDRNGDQLRVGAKSAVSRRVAAELLQPNALLLSTLAQAGNDAVAPVYRWFVDGIEIADKQRGEQLLPLNPGPLLDRLDELLQSSHRREAFVELLKAADLGIEDIRIVHGGLKDVVGRDRAAIAGVATKVANVGDRYRAQLETMELIYGHHTTEGLVEFSVTQESVGTLAWTVLAFYVLNALENGSVLLVDELDKSLHPLLVMRLVEMFRDERTNRHGAQLLFNTHQSTFLGRFFAEPVLERDEVWLVQKDRGGVSGIYPLTIFKPGKNDNHERRYLYGQYEAVPLISDFRFEDSIDLMERSCG